MPPLRATTPPARGHATYTWDRLTPPQQEAVWELLRTDQTHRVARAARRRLVVLLSVVVLLLVALGLILFLLVSGALWLY